MKAMQNVYLIQGKRSFIGIENGMYRNLPAEELGGRVLSAYLKELEQQTDFRTADLDMVIAGNAVGGGGNITRLMALTAGLPESIPAYTVDLQCGSGLAAITDAAAKIASGQADVILAGGFESSSTAPLRTYSENHPGRGRFEKTYGRAWYRAAPFSPGGHLENAMLRGAEMAALSHGISRESLNRWVIRSHEMAKAARELGALQAVILPFPDFPQKDEGIRPRMTEKFCNYLPCVLPEGRVTTAANACLTNDGAAFLLLASEAYAKSHHLQATAQFLDAALTGSSPQESPVSAILAVQKILSRNRLAPEDISVYECNEAFAVIDELFCRSFGEALMDRYNIYGGALAYGHPYGASGGILTLHGLQALQRTKGSLGIFAAAGAGGVGSAILVKRLPSDYSDPLREQPEEKTALIADGIPYTYGDLRRESDRLRQELLMESANLSAEPMQAASGIQKTVTLSVAETSAVSSGRKTVHAQESAAGRNTGTHGSRDGATAIGQAKKLFCIQEPNVYRQLLLFLACQGTDYVPLILPKEVSPDDLPLSETKVPPPACMAVSTSGTTGKPKILFRSFSSWHAFFAVSDPIFGIGADTRMFAQGSLAFTGNLNLYLEVLCAGGCIIAESAFHPSGWECAMQKYDANLLYLIPSKLLLLPRIFKEENRRIRMILSGSQSLGREDAERLKAVFPASTVLLYYGASELNYITYVTDEDMTEDRSLIGKPFPGVDVSLQGDEFFVSTPYHIEGIHLPYSLSDCGRQDKDGRLYFTGRKDDILNIRGRKLSALKIENAIQKLDGISEVCVASVPYANDRQLAAFVVLDSEKISLKELSSRRIRLTLGETLSDFEVPKLWFQRDSLPKTDSGKILRRELSAALPDSKHGLN